MSAALSEARLAQLGSFIAERTGLHFPPARWRDLQRALEHAAPDLGFKDAPDCAAWMLTTDLTREQVDILATHLTISETYFFRDTALFQHLEHELLPALIERRRGECLRLRLWCAGCCTGEEAYSLAILLYRLLPDLPRWDLSLLATDINVRSLAKARLGAYGPWSFRGDTSWSDSRFFTAGPGKEFTVCPKLRSIVRFEYLNLAQDHYPSILNGTSDLDLIICRNVLMYFEPGAARATLGRFDSSLAADGWLVVAPSELSLVRSDRFVPVHFDSAILHRKAEAPHLRPAAAAKAPPAPWTPPPLPAAPKPLAPVPVAPSASAPDATVSFDAAQALYALHDYAAAHALASQLAARDTGDARVMRLLTRICANEGRLDEATAWCEKSIRADRVNPSGYYLRAVMLQEQGFHGQAAEALRQTIYLDPDLVIAHFTLGALCRTMGDGPAARRHWRNAAQLLERCSSDHILPESEGLSAARLREILGTLMETEPAL